MPATRTIPGRDQLGSLPAAELAAVVDTIDAELDELNGSSDNLRTLTKPEQTRFDELLELRRYAERHIELRRLVDRGDDRYFEHTAPGDHSRGDSRGGEPAANPLAYTAAALDSLQAALDNQSAARIGAAIHERAALTTGTYGGPRVWGANVLSGPRMLHVAARIPQQRSAAVFAQFPVLTLPTATGSVAENVSLAEYAAVTAGSATLGRFGRFTDLSRESQVGADAGAIVAAHVTGVALDLDNVLINAVETAAGAAVAFSADVPAAIRKALATVAAATAAADAGDLVVLAHPDNVALLESVTPVGGETIGQGFARFSGALVYPSTAVNTGFITVANLRAGARYFEARSAGTEIEIDVKTGTVTVATSVIANFGLTLTGFASMVDVVTP